jgi:hypothetical protein
MEWNGMCCSENMTMVFRSIHQGCYEPEDTQLVKCSIWKSMISGNPLVTQKCTHHNFYCITCVAISSQFFKVFGPAGPLHSDIIKLLLHRYFKLQKLPTDGAADIMMKSNVWFLSLFHTMQHLT